VLDVVKPGLQTCIQDHPGRIGFWAQGFPPSGPMDAWSFRLANLLVGNAPGAPGLECQLIGPTLRFGADALIALTGADMQARLDGVPVPSWESVAVRAGQTLVLGPARRGARAYLALAGGIDAPRWLGSASTFHQAGVGGLDGHALSAGQRLALGRGTGRAGRRVKEGCRPPLSHDKRWSIEVVPGPQDDWIDAEGQRRFLSADWKLESRSNRTGYRLEGPEWSFTSRAYDKPPENGSDPSNIIDQGYPLGAINLCGQKPIILVNDGPSMGGFICPYTVPSAAFWKLGQAKPLDVFRFRSIDVEEAHALRRRIDALCSETSLE
jgi:urea carboxylase